MKTYKHSPRYATPLAVWLGIGLLAGCAPGPAYVRPALAVPAQFKEARADTVGDGASNAGWLPARPSDDVNRGPWWTLFNDSTLSGLEARVNVGNQAIMKSIANLEQARATMGTARSAYQPTITASVGADRGRTSSNVLGRSLAGKTVSDYNAGPSASWEPDLFHRIGYQVDAAHARYQASEADLASVRLAMQAELAINYVDLRELDDEAALLKQSVDDYAKANNLLQIRFNGGIASRSDLEQAQTQWQIAQTQLTDLGVSRSQHEHAIAILIGVPPSQLTVPAKVESFALPAVPAGLPSTLLERRPDIAAAERRVAADNADVGAATSAFFPDLVLSASGGFESSTLAKWATLPSRFWDLGPSLMGTLFDGGRRKSELAAAKARQAAATADYRQTVLDAFRDVEDNLASLNVLADESGSQSGAVDSSTMAAQLAMTRYQAGATDYLEVVATQSVNLTQKQNMVALNRRRLEADIELIKALGGAWNQEPSHVATR